MVHECSSWSKSNANKKREKKQEGLRLNLNWIQHGANSELEQNPEVKVSCVFGVCTI